MNDDTTILESLIDKQGLTNVLSELASICSAKSEHVAISYDDSLLAYAWDKAATAVEACAQCQAVVLLPS